MVALIVTRKSGSHRNQIHEPLANQPVANEMPIRSLPTRYQHVLSQPDANTFSTNQMPTHSLPTRCQHVLYNQMPTRSLPTRMPARSLRTGCQHVLCQTDADTSSSQMLTCYQQIRCQHLVGQSTPPCFQRANQPPTRPQPIRCRHVLSQSDADALLFTRMHMQTRAGQGRLTSTCYGGLKNKNLKQRRCTVVIMISFRPTLFTTICLLSDWRIKNFFF